MRALRLAATALLFLASAPADAQDATVRVRLFGGPLAAPELNAEGQATVTAADGSQFLIPDGEDATARTSRGEVTLMGHRSSRFEVEGGVIRVHHGRKDRAYTGRLVLTAESGKVQLVNHVALPDYVASVVASEYPFDEIEGVKAQAVLARTYVLRRRGAKPDYDLDDHQGSQVYKGTDVVTPVTRRATEETTGIVLTYRGELAEAFYSSSSGGHTAANESIWNGAPLPYLRAVPDPYDAQAPDHRWTQRVDAGRLHAALSATFGGRVSGFDITRRGPSGRAVEIALRGGGRSSISGNQFRSAVNASMGWRTIRSTQFTARRDGSAYVFEGGGFGHGVGMSQYGARGAARQGLAYDQILAHYFPGTDVTSAGGAPVASRASDRPRVAPTPRVPTPRTPTADAAPGVPRYLPPTARTRPTPRHIARAEAETTEPPRRKAW